MINELGGVIPSSPVDLVRERLASDARAAASHRTPAIVPDRSWSVQSGLVWATALGGASVLAVFSYGLAAGSQPGAVAAAYLAAAPVVAGLTWSVRRPGTHTGAVVVMIGLAGWLVALERLGVPEAQTAGQLARPALLALLVYSLVTMPAPAWPPSGLRWMSVFGIAVLVVLIGSPVVAIGAAVGMVCWWSLRARGAGMVERRELMFIGPMTLALLAAVMLGWDQALIGALVLLPLAYIATLVQAEISAARALDRLLDELSAKPSLGSWQQTVARVLGDPSLRLVSWDPDASRFRDAGMAAAPTFASATEWVPILHRGRDTVAVMSFNPRAAVEPELVRAAGAATRLAVEYGYREGQLRKSLARLSAAADGERHRIARDLHDCAQQRLVTLRIHLSLAGETLARPDDRRLLEDLGNELDVALSELRDVSHGFYPVVLGRYGVAAALRSASSRTALPVRVEEHGLTRHEDAIERTVYFCCLEALQNAAKHAGQGASVVVRLVEEGGQLSFAVDDDGVGFAPETAASGAGLLNLADRLKAVGGSLQVQSAPGRGARITGRIGLPVSR